MSMDFDNDLIYWFRSEQDLPIYLNSISNKFLT